MRSQLRILLLSTLAVALLLVMGLGLFVGAITIDIEAFWQLFGLGDRSPEENILTQILLYVRMPRVLASVLVGGALAVSGAVMQGLFRNPLVEPGIIGVMSGASLAASFSIVLGATFLPFLIHRIGLYTLPLMAFLGAWGMTLLLYHFAHRSGRLHMATLLLLGIALGALATALTGLLTYLADDQELRSLIFWGMGSLAQFDWPKVGLLGLVCVLCLPFLLRQARLLDALLLGEHVATHLGFSIERGKQQLIFLVALLVGTAVAFTGIIAFIGLIVPHMIRHLVGSRHRYVLPGSFILGALILCLADALARTLVAPEELPIGIITALLGAPFLAYLVWRQLGRGER